MPAHSPPPREQDNGTPVARHVEDGCGHGWRDAVDCDACTRDRVGFAPDWKLPRRDALAIAVRISLARRGVTWGDNLHTDEQWAEMADEIIAALEADR